VRKRLNGLESLISWRIEERVAGNQKLEFFAKKGSEMEVGKMCCFVSLLLFIEKRVWI
jgi:hypothetical protein